MSKPLIRIPYTDLLAPATIVPRNANTLPGAIAALQTFFATPSPHGLPPSTVVLSGAGLSVSSGLADYRGPKGTYRVNKSYRPIYYHEFLSKHESRKRYWARSFLGWTSLEKAQPNQGHRAVRDLGDLGVVGNVITQNVDSFHPREHPQIPTLELHGYLRSVVCTSCRTEYPREEFQKELARLNPAWDTFLQQVLKTGALDYEDPDERRARGIRTNPDGDVDLPGAPYTTFRYPACAKCLAEPPTASLAASSTTTTAGSASSVTRHVVEIDSDGAWLPSSTAGILKPAVVMFGENIRPEVKTSAEEAIDSSGKLLVLGTSLATYSAWRLAKRALDRRMPVAIINMGGVRGEDTFLQGLDWKQTGEQRVRVDLSTDKLLPAVVKRLREEAGGKGASVQDAVGAGRRKNHDAFKDMLS